MAALCEVVAHGKAVDVHAFGRRSLTSVGWRAVRTRAAVTGHSERGRCAACVVDAILGALLGWTSECISAQRSARRGLRRTVPGICLRRGTCAIRDDRASLIVTSSARRRGSARIAMP